MKIAGLQMSLESAAAEAKGAETEEQLRRTISALAAKHDAGVETMTNARDAEVLEWQSSCIGQAEQVQLLSTELESAKEQLESISQQLAATQSTATERSAQVEELQLQLISMQDTLASEQQVCIMSIEYLLNMKNHMTGNFSLSLQLIKLAFETSTPGSPNMALPSDERRLGATKGVECYGI